MKTAYQSSMGARPAKFTQSSRARVLTSLSLTSSDFDQIRCAPPDQVITAKACDPQALEFCGSMWCVTPPLKERFDVFRYVPICSDMFRAGSSVRAVACSRG